MKNIKLFIAIIAITIASCKSTKDTTNDQVSTQTERSEKRGPRGGEKGKMSPDKIIEQFDANGDGKLVKLEVRGPLAENFDQIDSNSDGYITKEEIENAPRPRKR